MKSVEQSMSLMLYYNHLNKHLFEDKLESEIYVGTSYSLKHGGLFLHDKWDDNVNHKTHHEILVDENLLNEGKERFTAALVHAMIHLWQFSYGQEKPSRKNYHNQEFVNKSKEIGLIMHTGDDHEYSIDPEGKFMQVIQSLDEKILPKPRNAAAQLGNDSKSGKRVKYTCPQCGGNLWGKSGKKTLCGDCFGSIPDELLPYLMKQEES